MGQYLWGGQGEGLNILQGLLSKESHSGSGSLPGLIFWRNKTYPNSDYSERRPSEMIVTQGVMPAGQRLT